MFNIIDSYCRMIIKPIEDEKSKLIMKLNRKNLFDIISKSLCVEYLDKYDELLLSKYKKLKKLIDNETKFHEK